MERFSVPVKWLFYKLAATGKSNKACRLLVIGPCHFYISYLSPVRTGLVLVEPDMRIAFVFRRTLLEDEFQNSSLAT
jgi:hypothetical protein